MQEPHVQVPQNIVVEKRLIDGVPTITFQPADGKNFPVIFFLHGFSKSKEDGQAIGRLLAQAGMRAICVDLYMHGDHRDPIPFPGMFPIIQHTTDDLCRLMQRFHEDARGRIGVIGVSMGAMVAFHLAATEPMVQAVVSMIGNPDFEANFLRLTEIDRDLKWLSKSRKQLWESMLSMGQTMNPKERLAQFYPKPLLLINGRHDPFVELKHASALYDRLQYVYTSKPECLQLQVFETAHEVTPAMDNAAAAWFSKHLMEQ